MTELVNLNDALFCDNSGCLKSQTNDFPPYCSKIPTCKQCKKFERTYAKRFHLSGKDILLLMNEEKRKKKSVKQCPTVYEIPENVPHPPNRSH